MFQLVIDLLLVSMAAFLFLSAIFWAVKKVTDKPSEPKAPDATKEKEVVKETKENK